MNAVRASGLIKRYDGHAVLSLNSLALEAERVHVIVGPNGSGKTTLLRLIAGIELQDEGELRVLESCWGEKKDTTKTLRGRIGFVLQKPYLFSTTVRGNVEYAPRARGMSRSEASKRADEAMEKLGIAHLAERQARNLSAGETKRTAIARAITVEPQLLLLDEPLGSVDAEYAKTITSLIADSPKDGVTVLVATHVPDFARQLSADIVQLDKGSLVSKAD